VKAAIEQTLARYGRLDAVHNNAGIATPSKPLHETSEAEWDALLKAIVKVHAEMQHKGDGGGKSR